MNIQIGFYNERANKIERPEDLIISAEFLILAEMLSILMEALKEIKDPTMSEIKDKFYSYINDGRKENEKLFANHCKNSRKYYEKMKKKLKDNEEFNEDEFVLPDAKDFHSDIRAFIGKLILNNTKEITPSVAEDIIPFLGLFSVLLKHYMKECENENQDLYEAFEVSFNIINTIGEYCDAAITKKKSFSFKY